MKKFIYRLLLSTVILTISAFAKDTVYVASDVGGNEGSLNAAIKAKIDAGTLSNTVFKLERYGYYVLNGIVNVPATQTLELVADPPGNTQETAPPQIVLSSAISSWRYTFACYGDLIMKNIWLLYANTGRTQQSASLELEDDTVSNASGKGKIVEFENVIFDYAPVNGSVESRTQKLRATFRNCYWRNNCDPHFVYYGRAISWPYQSTTWHTDTLIFENCTFSNMGYGIMQEAPEYSTYVWLNHCTFYNIMAFPLESSYWYWLNVSNTLFINTWMHGDIQLLGLFPRNPANDPTGGTLYLDSIKNANFTAPYKDSARHILFTNNAYYMEKWLTDYMDHGNAYSDTATICKPRPQPMMNRRTIMMFDTTVGGKKYWPYLNRKNLTEGVDPGFMMAPSNQDGIKAFLLGRWLTGANIDWAYNISEDLDGIWPMNENLSYTNTTLKTAAMGGFPLGDLFHWWPAAYAQWKAQRTTENTNLSNWLKNGLTEVRLLDGNVVPAEYALSQNYPNPFNPTTQIDYSIPQSGLVSLKVYDLLGKEVKTLYEGVQSAGNYVATFDGSKFTGGVYFYRLQTDNFSMTKKLVLIK